MHSVISSEKFQKSEFELPVAIGKTISNETLVFDLAKMPHLLMAGATGQGKTLTDEAYDAGYQTIMETTGEGSPMRDERLNILNHQYLDQI